MTHASLERAWTSSRAAIGGWVGAGGQFSLELYRRSPFDYVGIDCQHSALSDADAVKMLQAGPVSDIATLVRVSSNDAAVIGKLADAGADGVIVPMVNTPDEAAAAVAACTFPPDGVRSFGPLRVDMTRDLDELTGRVSVFVMIETREGLDNVEEICKTPGLAGIYIGPGDLSIGLGLDPKLAFSSDQLVEPTMRIRAACEANGRILGMHASNGARAAEWAGRGVRLLSLGTDVWLFLSAVTAELDAARAGVGDVGIRTDRKLPSY
jgi:4-hydroxy-2-oxoheptanedioate aldolase